LLLPLSLICVVNINADWAQTGYVHAVHTTFPLSLAAAFNENYGVGGGYGGRGGGNNNHPQSAVNWG
jgi:hypothetical protein